MKRPSPSMAVSLTALVVALGGTATAGTLITSANVKDGSLTGRDVRDGSITRQDLAPAVRNLFASGTTGTKKEPPLVVLSGPPGPQGPAGPAGPAAGGLSPSKVRLRQSETRVVQAGEDVQTAIAFCDPGEIPTGGGFYSNIAHTGISGPHVDSSTRQLVGWSVTVDGLALPAGGSQEFRAFAVCVGQ
jgi:hypothetical protein